MKIHKYSPDKLLSVLVRKFRPPAFARFALRWGWFLIAWTSLISSILSIVSATKWAIDAGTWLLGWCIENYPKIIFVFEWISAAIEIWRDITQPLFHFFFGWLPFDIPRITLDFVIVASILLTGQLQAWFATAQERQFLKAIDPELSRVGRAAVIKRIYMIIGYFETHEEGDPAFEKAERELEMALGELSANTVNSRENDEIIDFVLTQPKEDLDHLLSYVSNIEYHRYTIRRKFIIKSFILSAIILGALLLDFIYLRWFI